MFGILKRTIKDKRWINANNFDTLFIWIDVSYAVHDDMKGYTGIIMPMGTGALHCKSSTQKINTKSTTESELVGVSEYLPYNIWYMLFLGAQGYTIK